jgi:DNA-binding NarL/FixJ family response regulator
MQEPTIRVLVFEADGLFRDMLRSVLKLEPRLTLTGATSDPVAALTAVADDHPDVVLIGLDRETEHAALSVAQSIAALRAGTKIVFLGDNPDRRTMAAMPAFRAAGWSYLLRQSVNDVATLVRAIEGAAAGLVVMDPTVVEQLGQRDSRLGALTKRQLEVLSLMARGNNNAAIARTLVLEEKSVENHINAIFGQLNLSRDNAAHPRVKAVLLYLSETEEETVDQPEAPAATRKAA